MPLENGYTVGVVMLYDRLKRFGFIAPLDEDTRRFRAAHMTL
jgi:hypothetical protein